MILCVAYSKMTVPLLFKRILLDFTDKSKIDADFLASRPVFLVAFADLDTVNQAVKQIPIKFGNVCTLFSQFDEPGRVVRLFRQVCNLPRDSFKMGGQLGAFFL